MPGSSAELFLDYIDAQDLPMDTLAARGKRYDAVEILTPALAAGRHWQTVYVSSFAPQNCERAGTGCSDDLLLGALLNPQALPGARHWCDGTPRGTCTCRRA